MSGRRASVPERMRQVSRLLRDEGAQGVVLRFRERAANAVLPPGARRLSVSQEDFRRAAEVAAGGWRLPGPAAWRANEPLHIAWICIPPSRGSGGHATIFRMIESLERAGHRCVVYIYERHGWEIGQHRRNIRAWWPSVRADVRALSDGIEDCHAIFATAWETAYALLGSQARGVRFYFVQDFEPWFSPAGSESLLAEATYRFGYVGVTAGEWLARVLRQEYGMEAGHFDFGCDLESYSLETSSAEGRTGVCYYCRPATPRRAHELAVFALELFASRNPDVDIHLYGQSVGGLPFRATQHGLLTPAELGSLYNRCAAGLVLSATNVSLVPHEMLAAGCIPVVNEAEHNRIVLDNPNVVYTPATPWDLAEALSDLVRRPAAERAAAAETAAASVSSASWSAAGAEIERILRDVVEARQTGEDPATLPRGSVTALRLAEGG